MNRGKVQSNWVEILAIGLVEVLWLLSFHRYKRNMHDSFVTSPGFVTSTAVRHNRHKVLSITATEVSRASGFEVRVLDRAANGRAEKKRSLGSQDLPLSSLK